MDNQGTSTSNSNSASQDLGANFWNPNPNYSSQSLPRSSASSVPQNNYTSAQYPNSNSNYYPGVGHSPTSSYGSNYYSSNQYGSSSGYSYNSNTNSNYGTSSAGQGTILNTVGPSVSGSNSASPNSFAQNLINKDFSQMTDEEKKEAERIAKARNRIDLLKTIGLIVISLLALLFIGLFIWMSLKWGDANTNIQGKIDVAVAEAKNELQKKLENDFEEKEKYPYLTFTGPSDFGALSFEYPKTWSLHIPEDASRGGDFHAYLNPGQVNVVSDATVMSLRVTIKNELTDQVLQDYVDKVQDGEMTVATTVVNRVNVNVYTGKLDSGLMGIVCVFKIRDKTAIIQTDSSNVFKDDFYRILNTIRFNS